MYGPHRLLDGERLSALLANLASLEGHVESRLAVHAFLLQIRLLELTFGAVLARSLSASLVHASKAVLAASSRFAREFSSWADRAGLEFVLDSQGWRVVAFCVDVLSSDAVGTVQVGGDVEFTEWALLAVLARFWDFVVSS